MNNHGSIQLWVIYRLSFPAILDEERTTELSPAVASYTARKWLITGHHAHIATNYVELGQTVEDVRARIAATSGAAAWLSARNIGRAADDEENVVEQWVIPWGAETKVAHAG